MKGNRCGKEKLCLKQQFSLIEYFFWTSWCFCARFFFPVWFSSIWCLFGPWTLILVDWGFNPVFCIEGLGVQACFGKYIKSIISVFLWVLLAIQGHFLSHFSEGCERICCRSCDAFTWIRDPQMWDPSYKFYSGSAREAYEKLMGNGGSYFLGPWYFAHFQVVKWFSGIPPQNDVIWVWRMNYNLVERTWSRVERLDLVDVMADIIYWIRFSLLCILTFIGWCGSL